MTGTLVGAVELGGLSASEARERQVRDGPNVVPPPPMVPAWRHALAQFVGFFAAMLWIAAVLALVAGLPQLGLAIVAVVVLNGTFATVQERRAERAAAALRDLLPRRATVVRDGVQREIDAVELVVGDVLVLSAGDRVGADAVVRRSAALRLDLSAMTGESEPVAAGFGDRIDGGTFVVEGEATTEVVAVGSSTRLARLAVLSWSRPRPPSPLARELHRLVRVVAMVAVGVGAALFGLTLLLGRPAADGFVIAIGVTVALVPESMLPTVTLSLAVGAQRMARHHALVRRLESVETLGSVTFICTDKTGTLTTNQMAVTEVWTPAGSAVVEGDGYEPTGDVHPSVGAGPAVERLALAAGRCSTGSVEEVDGSWIAHGDAMEAALVVLAARAGADLAADVRTRPTAQRFPFDPRRRRMSVEVDGELLVKGAPDSVLPRCTRATEGAAAALEALSGRGLRVLAVASRTGPVPEAADAAERDLELLGLVALADPPRPGVAEALAECRRAGVRVAMVTGDHPATARTVAAEIGLAGGDPVVLTGDDLPEDDQVLGALVDRDGIVLARITPEDKLRIAAALQARGHVVAMTGDGVNDGPALQAADIGIAMGRTGTDVAREAADLVLLEEDFSILVEAVRQGRGTFANIRRFLAYHLTANVAELFPFVLWAVAGGRFPLMIGVLQVLAIDVGTDTLPAVALGAERAAATVLTRPPATGHLLNRRVALRAFGVMGPAEAVMSLAAFLTVLVADGWRPGTPFPTGGVLPAASGAAWGAIVFGQLANAIACRSLSTTPWQRPRSVNPLLLAAVAVEAVLVTSFLVVPPLAALLDQSAPTTAGWVVVLLTVPVVLVIDTAEKRLHRRSRAGRPLDRTRRSSIASPGA